MTTTLSLHDCITKNPRCLKMNDSVFEAAKLMKDLGIGVIPIVDENQKPCGVLTDRDIIVRCIGENHDFKQCKVTEVCSKRVEKLYEDQTLDDAINLMKKNQLRRLVCVDRNDKLCGMLSLADLARNIKDTNILGDLVRQVHLEKGQTQRQ